METKPIHSLFVQLTRASDRDCLRNIIENKSMVRGSDTIKKLIDVMPQLRARYTAECYKDMFSTVEHMVNGAPSLQIMNMTLQSISNAIVHDNLIQEVDTMMDALLAKLDAIQQSNTIKVIDIAQANNIIEKQRHMMSKFEKAKQVMESKFN